MSCAAWPRKAWCSVKKQVFEGIKVADFSWVGVGPETARELAEHGATVIRIESHKRPETLRLTGPFKDFTPGVDRSAFGTAYNTNKYGISLDLTHARAREVTTRLIKWADIVTDGFTPGTMKRLGLDYEACRRIRPDTIYFSTCQQGQDGPHANFGAYGVQMAALAGFSHLTGWPDRAPAIVAGAYTDFISPFYLTIAVIGALLHRRRTGEGMYMEQSQMEAGLTFLAPSILDYHLTGRVASRRGNRDAHGAPHGVFPCEGTERWAAIAVGSDDEWAAFQRAIGEPPWSREERFATLAGRKEHEDDLEALVAEWTRGRSVEEVVETLQAHGVPAGVVAACEDLFNDPQLQHRGHFAELEHEEIGLHSYHAPAYRLSKTPSRLEKAGPCLGQDNDYVYREILCFSDDEVAELLVDGVITTEADLPY